jgi:hypothetical protein
MAAKIYQLKITLKDVKPPIWRRILVSETTALDDLHYIIQIVMGWTNSHLHQFIIGREYYSILDESFGNELEQKDSSKFKLKQLGLSVKSKFLYEYDFGDGWLHEILVEAITEAEPGKKYPLCTDGKRACPPEDCGGPWGYADVLEIIKDPKHPEHEDWIDWLPEDFDPEYFSADEVNKQLFQ